MKINGRAIAEGLLQKLTADVARLKISGITPTLAVIQIGDNPASLAYIKQKQIAAEKIGAKVIVSNTLLDVTRFNEDPYIHGLIVQRPVPIGAGEHTVTPKKDVDGFEENSPFDVPVAIAVYKILQSIKADFSKKFVVIGRGETAGKPILHYLEKLHCTTSLIHSKTPNSKEIMKHADVIISCVGKERVVTRESIKSDAILISVGIWRDSEGKLRGDYNEEEILDIASFYTPTPGGVGPVNVACLMQNLVKASTIE